MSPDHQLAHQWVLVSNCRPQTLPSASIMVRGHGHYPTCWKWGPVYRCPFVSCLLVTRMNNFFFLLKKSSHWHDETFRCEKSIINIDCKKYFWKENVYIVFTGQIRLGCTTVINKLKILMSRNIGVILWSCKIHCRSNDCLRQRPSKWWLGDPGCLHLVTMQPRTHGFQERECGGSSTNYEMLRLGNDFCSQLCIHAFLYVCPCASVHASCVQEQSYKSSKLETV